MEEDNEAKEQWAEDQAVTAASQSVSWSVGESSTDNKEERSESLDELTKEPMVAAPASGVTVPASSPNLGGVASSSSCFQQSAACAPRRMRKSPSIVTSSSDMSSGPAGSGGKPRLRRRLSQSAESAILESRQASVYTPSIRPSSTPAAPTEPADAKPATTTAPPEARAPSLLLSTILALSLFSVLGEALRIITEEFFGNACHQPDTAEGWNGREWAPCTTDPGTTDSTGGAMFIDLPANVLGCFLMGLVVSGDQNLGLPVDLPIAAWSRNSGFQSWTVWHLAIRTGFCGALTTFASWNAQMVVMICAGGGTVLDTQWISALFGYGVGMVVALGSYVMGRHAAVACFRWANPELALESDALEDMGGKYGTVAVHRELGDVERRFLHDIVLDNMDDSKNGQTAGKLTRKDAMTTVEEEDNVRPSDNNNKKEYGMPSMEPHMEQLQQWKDTTYFSRVHHGIPGIESHTEELFEIERMILLRDDEPREELLRLARVEGWDVDALLEYRRLRPPPNKGKAVKCHCWQRWSNSTTPDQAELRWSVILLSVCTAFLLWGSVIYSDPDPTSVTNRTSCLSCLFAPPGTLCRWHLSRLNKPSSATRQRLTKHHLEWLPVGTLLANLIASVISLVMIGISLKLDADQHVAHSVVMAIKGGFAGSLSTVSTFAGEVWGLGGALPQHGWAYGYALGSLGLALVLGVCSYVWAVV